MVIKWKDERYIEENKARESECVSGQVTWTKKGQFWIPYFYVPNALSLVSKRINAISKYIEHSVCRMGI